MLVSPWFTFLLSSIIVPNMIFITRPHQRTTRVLTKISILSMVVAANLDSSEILHCSTIDCSLRFFMQRIFFLRALYLFPKTKFTVDGITFDFVLKALKTLLGRL